MKMVVQTLADFEKEILVKKQKDNRMTSELSGRVFSMKDAAQSLS